MPAPSSPNAIDFLKLSLVVGISVRKQKALVEFVGSASNVLRWLELRPDAPLLEEALAWADQDARRHIVTWEDARYPPLLREIDDPPLALYVEGRVELLASTCFAIVGARNASTQGRVNARAFAHDLSEAGLCIVSGLAHGVDAAAHEGALMGKASSIAVLGTGIDRVYPQANTPLAGRLAESGCIVTEYCLGMPPLPGNFLRRNRLISGLSRGVLVVEANDKSGSLTTARLAAQQNRDVFAIPGSIHSSLSKGCHKLIKEGAKLSETTSDILSELGLEPVARTRGVAASIDEDAHPLLAAMGFDHLSPDEIAQRTGLAVAAIAAQLSLYEMEGRVGALPGGRFQRIDGAG